MRLEQRVAELEATVANLLRELARVNARPAKPKTLAPPLMLVKPNQDIALDDTDECSLWVGGEDTTKDFDCKAVFAAASNGVWHWAYRDLAGLMYLVPILQLEIYLGKTDEAAAKHTSTTYTVSRYSDTSTDTGTNDEVLQLFATTVGSGKWCIYVKIGSAFYMIAAEC